MAYCDQLKNMDNYYMYADLVNTGRMNILTSDICRDNFIQYFEGIMNIFRDGIETEEVQNMFLTLIFDDKQKLEINIIDFFFNLTMWRQIIDIGQSIEPCMLFFPENFTQNDLKKYIDNVFLLKYRDERNILEENNYDPETANIILNRSIDNSMYGLSYIDEFSFYLMNTVNLKDDIELWKQNPRFKELLHSDFSNIPIEQVKDAGMELAYEAIDIIKNSNHCLSDSFKAKQGINIKQYKEFEINEGTKPDGQGSVFPIIINHSFVNGGVSDLNSFFVESASGRLAQIIAKCNVGTSGAFARILGLNNRDSFLHHDPKYVCDSRNFEVIIIKDKHYLETFEGRYYRTHPFGMESCISLSDTHLIGKKLYIRSPMKCASAARGEGVCYRCYGKLAYTNASINIGQYASENLSAKLTQKQLSAKHLLESSVIALEWSDNFDKYFEVSYNTIKLKEDFDYTGYSIIINPSDIRLVSEDDDYVYNEYINVITLRCPDGTIENIYTKNNDALYISNDLNTTIRKMANKVVEGNHLSISLDNIDAVETVLFVIQLTNNEFSATLDRISNIINLDAVTTSYDSHMLLQEFIEAVKDGGLGVTAVHLEVILMNQLRDIDNILETPDWSVENQECSVLTLNQALTNNPSVTVSMTYQLTNVYYNPLTYRKSKPSFMDLLFMEKPQEYFHNKGLYRKDKVTPSKPKPIQ